MSVREWAALAIAVATLAFSGVAVQQAWRSGELGRWERRIRVIWPWSESALQGWLRATPTVWVGALLAVLLYPIALADPASDPNLRWLAGPFASIAIVATVLVAATAASIILLNRPRRLVFPALRSQEGLLQTWRRAKDDVTADDGTPDGER